jgi:uncharacterized protein (TIGR03435 family)
VKCVSTKHNHFLVVQKPVKFHCRVAIPALFLTCSLVICRGQAPLTFEVASVKPNASLGQNMSLNRKPDGGIEAVNATLRTLITFAYDVHDYQLSGGPAWLDTDRYDVVAKAPAGAKRPDPNNFFDNSATGEIRLRTQALLAERFKLAVHKESKEMPVYALVVDKGGPKLTPWKESDGPGPSMRGEYTKITCRKYSMQRFADAILSTRMGRTVLDKTGIEGEFTIVMTFQPDPPAESPGSALPAGPTFLDALREQLRLKLVSTRGPVETLMIDHAEKASAN